MPAQDKTDLLAIALDKRVTAVEHKLDTLEKLIRALGDAGKAFPALEAKVKSLEDKKQDKKDDAAVAQKMQAQLNKQFSDQAKQQGEIAKQQAKEAIIDTRLKVVESMVNQALTMARAR